MPSLIEAYHGYELSFFDHCMVLCYAQRDYYHAQNSHVLLVQKPEGKMHAGMWNLPGGYIQRLDPMQPGEGAGYEHPADAAVRELKEETGLEGSFPQFMGALLPDRMKGVDDHTHFIVLIYRMLVRSSQELVSEPRQPAQWRAIHSLATEDYNRCVPGLKVLIPLLIAGLKRFEIFEQDGFGIPRHSVRVSMPNEYLG